MARVMTARFAGRCRNCDVRIAVGDTIVYGGRGNTRHADCPGDIDSSFYNEDNWEARQARYDDAEYAKGVRMAEHISDTARYFGEAAAVAEEMAWELRDPAY